MISLPAGVKIQQVFVESGQIVKKDKPLFTFKLNTSSQLNYQQVATTMCHELAHCIHQNHGPAFWKLMKELQQEHQQWTQSGAATRNTSAEEQFGFDIYGAATSRTKF